MVWKLKYCRCGSIVIAFNPLDTELGWKPLVCGAVTQLLFNTCQTYVFITFTAMLVVVAPIGRNHIMDYEVHV